MERRELPQLPLTQITLKRSSKRDEMQPALIVTIGKGGGEVRISQLRRRRTEEDGESRRDCQSVPTFHKLFNRSSSSRLSHPVPDLIVIITIGPLD